jgi:hypothetical protein
MNLTSNSSANCLSNLEQYIKKTYIIINSSELSLNSPIIHIIGMKDFQETFNDYLDYSFCENELIICLPRDDIFEYLTDYFNKMNNAETQFLIDAYRSVIFYNCHMFIGNSDINELNNTFKNTYDPILLKKIYCLCSQGSLAFIICACQAALYKRNNKHIISELEPNKQRKLHINITKSNNKINIVIYKTMRIVHIHKKYIETLHVLRFQIEYLINTENTDYTVESVISITFD